MKISRCIKNPVLYIRKALYYAIGNTVARMFYPPVCISRCGSVGYRPWGGSGPRKGFYTRNCLGQTPGHGGRWHGFRKLSIPTIYLFMWMISIISRCRVPISRLSGLSALEKGHT